MDHVKARELREQRAKLVADAQAIFGKEARTAEDTAKFDTMMVAADALKLDIDRVERMDTAIAETRTTGMPPAGQVTGGGDDTARQARFAQVWTRAMKFDGPAQFGFRGISAEDATFMREYRDMGTGGGNALQGAGGGYFVPVGFVDKVESAEKFYGNMLKIATIMPTATGQPLPFPTSNDTGTVGEIIAENATVTLTSDVTLGSIVFGAYKYSTKMVKVSIELLQDSAFDLDSFLAEKFGERLGRIRNTHYTVGTGAGAQPNGILTAATAGPTATGSATNDGGAETGGTSIGSDDLIELEHSVDPLYRAGAIYIGHDSTIKSLKKLKDKYGRPLWLPGLAVQAPDTINGYQYSVNNDMPTIAVNAKTLLFGNAKKYTIREVKELSILRLVERFAEFGQVAFIGFARSDGNLLDAGTHPVKYLVQAAA